MERLLSHSLFKNLNNVPYRTMPTLSPGLWLLSHKTQEQSRQSTFLLCGKNGRPVLPPQLMTTSVTSSMKAWNQHQKKLRVGQGHGSSSTLCGREMMSLVHCADLRLLPGLAMTLQLSASFSSGVDQECTINQGLFCFSLAKKWPNSWILCVFTMQVSCNPHIFLLAAS